MSMNPLSTRVEALIDASKTLVYLSEAFVHLGAQGVEARHSSPTKAAELAAELVDAAVGGASEDSGCGSVVLAGPHPPVKLVARAFPAPLRGLEGRPAPRSRAYRARPGAPDALL